MNIHQHVLEKAVAATLLLLLSALPSLAVEQFVTIEPPGVWGLTEAWAINSSGEIVGVAVEIDLIHFHGFRLGRDGVFEMIDFPGARGTSVRSINGRGDLAGYYIDGRDQTTHGWLRKRGDATLEAINYPGASLTNAWAINDRGTIVGRYVTGGITHGFILRGDPADPANYEPLDVPGATFTTAIAINAHDDIAGQYKLPGDIRTYGFVLRQGALFTIQFAGAEFTSANGVNSRGEVVGPYEIGGVRHGYLWVDGHFTKIDLPDALATHAGGINGRGDIVGYYKDVRGMNHAYLLPQGD
jgi:uncharacterized membrane protein